MLFTMTGNQKKTIFVKHCLSYYSPPTFDYVSHLVIYIYIYIYIYIEKIGKKQFKSEVIITNEIDVKTVRF